MVVKHLSSAMPVKEAAGSKQATQFPIPIPRHRHATPSGPWPFLELLDAVPQETIQARPKKGRCKHNKKVIHCDICLDGYPQSLFPNWMKAQQAKSGIYDVKQLDHPCSLISVAMSIDARGSLFSTPTAIEISEKKFETALAEARGIASEKAKVRLIFVDGISGPALKILGTIYDVEPFFWSSSLGWIPSRFQDSLDPVLKSDHITVILRFVRKVPKPEDQAKNNDTDTEEPILDVHKPLMLEHYALQPDLLAFHMIRSPTDTNTIISYHCSQIHGSTSAENLCNRLRLVGQSVYWTKIFQHNPDGTFVLLSMLWYALYSWDEALQELYNEIGTLESVVMVTLELTSVTNHLHAIRAHLMYFDSLLNDFRKAVCFLRDTPNPAVQDAHRSEAMKGTMKKECNYILNELARFEKQCGMQELRLENVINLGYSRLNIIDSKQATTLTQYSLRDSKASKHLAFLAMIFLPAFFMNAIFGMNIDELIGKGPGLHYYIIAAVSLTAVTIWVLGAMQLPYMVQQKRAMTTREGQETASNPYKWSRLWWPITLLKTSLTDEAEHRRLRGLEFQ
jgi:hypothetical protein